jgi:hypothetical protein
MPTNAGLPFASNPTVLPSARTGLDVVLGSVQPGTATFAVVTVEPASVRRTAFAASVMTS